MTTLKVNYPDSVASVFGSTDLDSLASSSTWVAGWSSAVIDNTSTLYTHGFVSGKFKSNNSSPTAGAILIWAGTLLDDSNYPDTFDGTSKAVTLTSVDIRNACLRPVKTIITGTATNQVYPFTSVNLRSVFGGDLPPKFFFWVTHSMVTALNATSGAGGQMYFKGGKYTQT